jgi:hypothetical protein
LQVTDWTTTISALTTGAGTLVLAVATFASVRSANRSARTAEASMRAGMRPVLMASRLQDPGQKLAFADDKWVAVLGGGAAVEATDGAIYLAISVRNEGTGMGILHGWRLSVGVEHGEQRRPPLAEFTPQTRDIYVASAEISFWQGALRNPDAELFKQASAAIGAGDPLVVDVLYGDFEGGQRVITRFTLVYSPFGRRGHGEALGDRGGQPGGHGDGTQVPADQPPARATPCWLASVVRHWNVDRPDPR